MYPHFTAMPKTFHSTVSLQVRLFDHLGDVAAVLLDLVSVLFSFFM